MKHQHYEQLLPQAVHLLPEDQDTTLCTYESKLRHTPTPLLAQWALTLQSMWHHWLQTIGAKFSLRAHPDTV